MRHRLGSILLYMFLLFLFSFSFRWSCGKDSFSRLALQRPFCFRFVLRYCDFLSFLFYSCTVFSTQIPLKFDLYRDDEKLERIFCEQFLCTFNASRTCKKMNLDFLKNNLRWKFVSMFVSMLQNLHTDDELWNLTKVPLKNGSDTNLTAFSTKNPHNKSSFFKEIQNKSPPDL